MRVFVVSVLIQTTLGHEVDSQMGVHNANERNDSRPVIYLVQLRDSELLSPEFPLHNATLIALRVSVHSVQYSTA
jgi:hypothetical protein